MPKWVILLIVLAAIGMLPLKFSIRLYREPNIILVKARVVIWIIPLEIRLSNPLTGLIFRLSHNRFWEKKAPHDIAAGEVPWKRLLVRTKNLRKLVLPVWRAANSFFLKIARPIKVKELYMHTEVGLSDAAQTALAVGGLWWMKSIVISRLSYLFSLGSASRNMVSIVPNFQMANFLRLDYYCIFEFRLGHIIIIIYQLMRSARELRSLLRRVSL